MKFRCDVVGVQIDRIGKEQVIVQTAEEIIAGGIVKQGGASREPRIRPRQGPGAGKDVENACRVGKATAPFAGNPLQRFRGRIEGRVSGDQQVAP